MCVCCTVQKWGGKKKLEPVFDGNDVNTTFNSFLNILLRTYTSGFPLIEAKNKMNQNSWITPGIVTSCKHKIELYKELKNDSNKLLHLTIEITVKYCLWL